MTYNLRVRSFGFREAFGRGFAIRRELEDRVPGRPLDAGARVSGEKVFGLIGPAERPPAKGGARRPGARIHRDPLWLAACARSAVFNTLPVALRGNAGINTIRLGTL